MLIKLIIKENFETVKEIYREENRKRRKGGEKEEEGRYKKRRKEKKTRMLQVHREIFQVHKKKKKNFQTVKKKR